MGWTGGRGGRLKTSNALQGLGFKVIIALVDDGVERGVGALSFCDPLRPFVQMWMQDRECPVGATRHFDVAIAHVTWGTVDADIVQCKSVRGDEVEAGEGVGAMCIRAGRMALKER